MSFHHQAKIVTDKLIWYFDPMNSKCYSGSGTTCYDLKRNIEGTIIGSPPFDTNYFEFTGTDPGISFSEDDYAGKTELSINCWALTYSGGSNECLFFIYGNTGPRGLTIQTGNAAPANQLMVYLGTSGTEYGQTSCTTNNVWFNVCLVYNGSLTGNSERLKMYFNGNQLPLNYSSGTVSDSYPTSASGSIILSRNTAYARYWNGRISACSIYDKALNSTEILQNYNAIKSRYGL